MIGKELSPFQAWCHKILPLVYEDSLSYYEYLCKVTEYLNQILEQMNVLTASEELFQVTMTDNWNTYKNNLTGEWTTYKTDLTTDWEEYQTALNAIWLQYKNYIDNYFNSLSVQEEINNKLDNMVLDGTMTTLIQPLFDTFKSEISNEILNIKNTLVMKADKSEVTNVMTPKGNLSYASLPTTGNTVGWYYYCSDGDETNGAGNYVWNGTAWYFGGTGDEGYNMLKGDLIKLDDYNLMSSEIHFNEWYQINGQGPQTYNERREYLLKRLNGMGLKCFEPFGAFYMFPSIQSLGVTSEEFCMRLLKEEEVAVVPGTAFGDCGEGFLRISYAYSIEALTTALDRIERFVAKLREEKK